MMYNLTKSHKLLLKAGAFAFFALLYFKGIIPVRGLTMDAVSSYIESNKTEDVLILKKAARTVTVGLDGCADEYQVRVPFGMNFFIGILGLTFMSASRKYFYAEVITQIVCGVVIFLTVAIGVQSFYTMLIISDLFSIYLLPLSSLVMVILAFIEKKQLKEVSSNEG